MTLIDKMRHAWMEHVVKGNTELDAMEVMANVVLDDMRAWAKNDYGAWPTSPSEFIDAYEKDRME